MMRNNIIRIMVVAGVIAFFISCSPKMITEKYYLENEVVLDKIEESYKELYPQKHFNIAFANKGFNIVSV